MSKRNCPYCAHSNATDAKFCVACGAAMHLAPCPHCGSINHINVEKCYRCGGDLPKQEILEGEPEAAPAPASSEPSSDGKGDVQPTVANVTAMETSPAVVSGVPPTVLVRESDAQGGRPSLAVMFIIICSFVFAGLYAARHRGSGTKEESSKGGSPTPPVTQTVAPSAPPAAPLAPVAAPPVESVKIQQEPAKPAPAAKTVAKPATTETPAKPAAPPTPCTEALAALGLCKLESK